MLLFCVFVAGARTRFFASCAKTSSDNQAKRFCKLACKNASADCSAGASQVRSIARSATANAVKPARSIPATFCANQRRRAWEYSPAVKIPPHNNITASSPTARKHSLLFGGAYTPNDAIYRKRYAFTEIIMPYNFYFSRARRQKQLSTVSHSLTRHFDQKTAENEPFLTCFRLFFYIFS